jgi:hypothetical protein
MVRFPSVAALALLALSLPVNARGAGAPIPPEPGVWWDVTTQMTVRGANVPPQAQTMTQTDRECLPKRIPDRAPPNTGECTVSDFRRSGPRVTFKLRCRDGVTGEADLVWTADTYSGTTVMRGQGMENRITTKGKKLGGDCDANQKEREEQAQAEGKGGDDVEAQQLKQRCADAAESSDPVPFLPPEPGAAAECKDATRFCAALETRRGLAQLRAAGLEDGPQQAGRLCKKDVAAIEKRLCAALAKEPEKKVTADEEASEFLFASCPDLAKGMAKRACAGRSFTGMPLARREFCTRWAQEALQGR